VNRSVLLGVFGLCLWASSSAQASDAISAPAPAPAPPASVVVVASVVSAAPEARPAGLIASYVAQVALQGFDAYSTLEATRRGGVEQNPLAGGLVNHPTAFVVVKGAVAAASIAAAEQLWHNHHPGRAIALMAVSNGLMAIVAVNNASVLHR
jgi:hypothetical protein